MVAFVSGNSLGLSNTSLTVLGSGGSFGSGLIGRSGEQAYVNLSNGNLVLQRQDDLLVSAGTDLNAVRTYNSEGLLADDNADNWSLGVYNQPLKLTGTLNTAGSTVTRTAADGAQSIYTYDSTRQLYVTSDGAGAYDTVKWDAATSKYVWTDGSTGTQERYEGTASAKLLSRTDVDGNTTTYTYGATGLLSSVTDASGEAAYYDYTGNNLSQIRVVTSEDGVTKTTIRVRYDYYPSSNLLWHVTVDLSPEDNSVTDGKVYTSTYTYDGSSKRVASVEQLDGSRLNITYRLVGSDYRVWTVTDGLGQVTTYDYDTTNRQTTVTDALGIASRYTYDAKGQLTQIQSGIVAGKPYGLSQLSYGYDSQGNVTSITDGMGHSITLQYDANGNQTLKVDPLGNTVTSTYNSQNQLVTETVSGNTGSASPASLSFTSRNVYDAAGKNRLRFALSAEGRVTEYQYNALGQRSSSLEYAGACYDLTGLASTAAPTEAQMQTWATAQDLSQGTRTDYTYDFRGQIRNSITYGTLSAAGIGSQPATTQFFFSQAGELLQTIQPLTDSVSTYTYDGLGRVTVSTQPSSDGVTQNIVTTCYLDSINQTRVTLVNGLSTLSVYDAAGNLWSVQQTNGGTDLGTTVYSYDQDNRLVKTKDPTEAVQWIVYDGAGRKVADVDGTGAATEYVYNANGQVTQTIAYANKISVAAAPTLADIRSYASSEDRKSWLIYDSAQRLVWQIGSLGYVTQTDYDSASRVVAVTHLATPVNTALIGDGASWVVSGSSLVTSGTPAQAATAVAVQASQPMVVQGSPVTLTAMVVGDRPDGTVTFYNGATAIGTATLANGVASLVVSNLPAGVDTISARYNGNTLNVASSSLAFQELVLAPTGVTVTPITAPVGQGSTVALTATITGGNPSGTVTFFDAGGAIGSAMVQVNAGVASATFYTSSLSSGSHVITAVYSGDMLNNTSQTVSSTTVTIAPLSVITLSSSAAQTTVGGAVTLTARVTMAVGNTKVTGTVAFYNGGTQIGTASVPQSGNATLTLTTLPQGVDSITAVYLGDGNAASCTSATLGQVVLPPGGTTCVLVPSYIQLASGSSLTLAASVTALAGGSLTGNVTFYDGATSLGSVAVSGGAASLTVNNVATGNHLYRAVYAGDTLDAGSTSATAEVAAVAGGPAIVSPPGTATAVTLNASATTVAQGTSVTFTANVGGSSPTGTVTFVSGSTVLGTANVVSGVATLSVSSLAVGSNPVQARYVGDGANPAGISTSAVTVNVTPVATQFALGSSAPSAIQNTPVVLTAQLTGGDAALPPTGTVTFYSAGIALGAATLINGVAVLSTSALALGSNSITVQYAGDANNAAGTSSVFSQLITPQPPTVNLSTSGSSVTAGNPITLTASFGGGTTPGGTVIFFNGQIAVGTATVVNGVATLVTSALNAVGTASITAVYGGDANNASAASGVVVIAITPPVGSIPVSVSSSSSSVLAGSPVTLTATVGAPQSVVANGVSLVGNTVTKTAGTYDWDASIRSTVGYTGGASVSFVAAQTDKFVMVGLNSDPATNDSYDTIDWALQLTSAGTLVVSRSGGFFNTVGNYSVGDTLSIVYDGAAVRYLKNGVQLDQYAAAISQPLYLDTSFLNSGAQITGLQFKNGAGQSLPLALPTTGSVTFFNGQTSLGTANIVNGTASLSTGALTAGTANITAYYGGDATNSSATSAATTIAVTNLVNLSASATNVAAGSPVTLTANLGALNTLQSMAVGTGVAISGNTVTKTAGTAAWDAEVRSTIGYAGGASVSFVAQQTNTSLMVGLNSDPTTDANQSSIDWAIYLAAGTAYIYQNGAYVATVGTYSVGDTFSVAYDGAYVRYAKNGVMIGNPQQAPLGGQLLYLDSSFYSPNAQVGNLQFSNQGTLNTLQDVTSCSGVSLSGNTATKTTSTSGWDASIRSTVGSIGSARVSFVPQQTDKFLMVGLNSDPATNDSYDTLDWAWQCTNNGGLAVYQSGTYMGYFGQYSVGDVLTVDYDGSFVRYLRNGTVLYQQAATITQPLYLDSSFLSPNAQVSNLQFNRYGAGAGTVTFFNGQNYLGTSSIVNGSASLITNALANTGTANITAVYSGDAYNRAGETNVVPISVSGGTAGSPPATGIISVSSSSASVPAGSPVTLTANVGATPSVVTTGVSLAGGAVTKTSNSTGWDASIRTTVGYTGGASVSFVAQQTNTTLTVGLNSDPTTNDSYDSIDWGLQLNGGSLVIYQNGAMAPYFGSYNIGDTFSVTYDGSAVRYLKNGALLYQYNGTIAQPLYLDSSFYSPNAQITGLQFKNGAGQSLPLALPTSGSVTFFNGQTNLGTANIVNGTASLSTSALTSAGTANITAYYGGDAINSCAISAATAITVANPVSLGVVSAQYPGNSSSLFHLIGNAGPSSSWEAQSSAGAGFLTYGPYTSQLAAGNYSAVFRLLVDNTTYDNANVLTLDVYDSATGTVLASRDVSRSEFQSPFTAKAFEVPFSSSGTNTLEYRVYVRGYSYVRHLDTSIVRSSATVNAGSPVTLTANLGTLNTLQSVAVGTGVSISGNTVTKTAASSGWDASVRSTVGYTGGASVSFVPQQTDKFLMVGLNSDPATNDSYDTLDYAIQCRTDGTLFIYQGGNAVAQVGTYGVGDVLSVAFDGTNVRYTKNGILLYEQVSQTLPGTPLYLDSSFLSPNAQVSNLQFSSLGTLDTLQGATARSGVALWNNIATKTTSTSGWDASIRSTVGSIGSARVSFVPQQTDKFLMIGLNSDPATNDSYDTLDWAIQCRNDGTLFIYQSGTAVAVAGSYSVGDVLTVDYDGSFVRYLRNGTVLYQQAATITQPLYLDSSFLSPNAQVSNLQFNRYGAGVGTVTFFNGQTNLGTSSIVNGAATLITNALTIGGTANITAVYSGDAYNRASETNTVPISVVSPFASTTTTLSASASSVTRTDSVTLTATIGGGAAGFTPTGSVAFFDGGVLLGVGTVVNGVATLVTTGLPMGGNSLTAEYSGDVRAAASVSAAFNETVTKANAAVTVRSSIASRTATTATVTLTARITGATPSGTVVFYNNGVAVSGAVNIVNGVATFTATLPLGQASFTAQYSGDAGNNTATSGASALTLRGASTITVAAPTPANVTYGTAVTLSATAYYSATSPGTVTFYAGGKLVGVATVQSNGVATLTTNALPAGTQVITAAYSGNADHEAATQTAAQTVTVTGAATNASLTVSRITNPYGSALVLKAIISSHGWSTGISGTVNFYNGATFVGSATATNGVASLSLSNLPVGVDQLTAQYMGNGGYVGSTSNVAGTTVVTAASAVALSTSAATVAAGAPVTLTANVSGASPGGSVTFYRDSTALSTVNIVNGVATLVVNDLPSGDNNLHVTYTGDGHNGTSTSAILIETVSAQAASTLTRTSGATVAQNGSITIYVGSAAAGGSVTLLNGTTVMATAPVINGVATLSAANLSAGTATLKAVYSGDGTRAGGVLQFSQTVTASLTVTSSALSATLTHSAHGLGMLLSAVISGRNPTGTVTFYNGSTVLGTVTLAYGMGALTLDSPLPATDQLRAVYSGDSTNATSTSATIAGPGSNPVLNLTVSTQDRSVQEVYDRDGMLRAKVDGEGYLTEYKYNPAGQRIGSVRYINRIANFINGPADIASQIAAARQTGSLTGLRPVADVQNDAYSATFYDARGRVTGELDAEGYLTKYFYDNNGNLLQVTRYANRITSVLPQNVLATTKLSQLVVVPQAEDRTTLRYYDALNRVVQETDPEGTVTRYKYDSVGNLVQTVRAQGSSQERASVQRYDAQGRVVAELSAEGSALLISAGPVDSTWIWDTYAIKHAYDAAGRRISTTDQNGHRTVFFYDQDSRITHSVNVLGEVTERQYNAFGQMTTEVRYGSRIDPAGLTGGLLTAAASGGSTLLTRLNPIKDAAKDSSVNYTYNTLGQVATITDALGQLTTFAYNSFGEESSRTQHIAAGRDTSRTSEYDRRGLQRASTLDAAGIAARTEAVYDAFGRLTSSKDANGNLRIQSYDKLGRAVTSVDPLNASRYTTYDAFDRVLTQRDALNQTTSYSYNAATRSMQVTTPEGITVTTVHTRLGQTQSVTDGLGNTTQYTYDTDGHLISTSTPLTLTSNSYDHAGLLIRVTDANGNQTQFTYDAANRVLTRTVGDAPGPVGPNGEGSGPQGLALTTSYAYDAKGQRISVTDPNGTVTTMKFDLDGQLKEQTIDDVPTGLQLKTSYTYDAQGNTLSVTDANRTVTLYSYNNLGQRTSEVVDPGTYGLNISKSYEYDNNGNVVRSVDGNQQATRYAYDADDRLVFTVDAAGNISKTTYDLEGRTLSVRAYAQTFTTSSLSVHPSVADVAALVPSVANPLDAVQNYVYDNDGRVKATIDGTGALVTFKRDANGNVIERTAYENRLQNWALGANVVPPSGKAVTTRTVYDALGRARFTVDGADGVVEQRYDANGNVTERIAYANRLDLAGHPLSSTPSETELQGRLAAICSASASFVPQQTDKFLMVGLNSDPASNNSYDTLDFAIQCRNDGTLVVYQSGIYTAQVGSYSVGDVLTVDYDGIYVRYLKNGAVLYQQAATITKSLYLDSSFLSPDAQVSNLQFSSQGVLSTLQDVTTRSGVSLSGNTVTKTSSSSGWDASIRITATKDGDTRYFYDAANRVTLTADGAGGVTQYLYDNNGNVTQTTRYAATFAGPGDVSSSANDQVTRNQYDAANRLLLSVDSSGAVTGYEHDRNGNVIKTTQFAQSLGSAYLNQVVNAGGNLVSISTPPIDINNDRIARCVYDAADREAFTIDAEGATTEFRYDGAGNLVYTRQFKAPMSVAGRNQIDAWHGYTGQPTRDNVMQYVTANPSEDRVTRQYFDAAGHLRFVRDGNLDLRGFTYDGAGRKISATLYASSRTGDPDLDPQITATTTASDQLDTFEYDAAGNLVSTTDAEGNHYAAGSDDWKKHTQRFTYDGLGRKTDFFNQLNSHWQYEYDGADNLVAEIAPPVEVSDGPGVTTTHSAEVITRMTYDGRGNLLSRTEATGHTEERTTRYEYDSLGRQTKTIYPPVSVYTGETAQQLATNGFSGLATRVESQLVSLTTETRYDALGNAVASVDMAGNWSYKAYDSTGRVAYDVDAMGYVTGYTRNAFGDVERLVRYGHAMSTSTSGAAPATADVKSMMDGTDHAEDRELVTTYDHEGRALTVAESSVYNYESTVAGSGNYGTGDISGGGFMASKTTRNIYNAFGEVTSVATLRGAGTGNWLTTATYYYDNMGRQTHIVDAMGYLTKQEYDAAGNLFKRIEFAKPSSSTLDQAGRPVADATDADNRVTSYTFDALNRKRTETRTVQYTDGQVPPGTDPQQLGAVTTAFEYDAVGNLVYTTDAYGSRTYSYYDALGRVTAVLAPKRAITLSDGSSAEAAPLTEFRRDALGNVVATIARARGAVIGTDAPPYTYTLVGGSSNAADDRTSYAKYDKLGRVIETTDAIGHVRSNSYDATGNLRKTWESVTTAGATQTLFHAFEYDKLGHQVSALDPFDTVTTQGVTTPGVSTTTTEYNAFGEVTRRFNDRLAGTEEYYHYDNAGRVWRTNAGDGVDKIYLYDRQGNLTEQVVSPTASLLTVLNPATLLANIAATPAAYRRTDMVYDALGRVTDTIAPGRASDLVQPVTVVQNEVTATIQPTGSEVVGLVNLVLPPMAQLGAGDLKIVMNYRSADFQGVGNDGQSTQEQGVPMSREFLMGAEEALHDSSLRWTDVIGGAAQNPPRGISRINELTIYKKNLDGVWTQVFTAANTGSGDQTGVPVALRRGTTIDVGYPSDLVGNTALEVRPFVAGQPAAAGWATATAVKNWFGSGFRFDLSAYESSPGTYEFRVTSPGLDGMPRVVGNGQFTAGQFVVRESDNGMAHLPPLATPLESTQDILNGQIHNVLRWDAPPPGTTVALHRRRVDPNTLNPIGGWRGSETPIFDAGGGKQQGAIDIDEAGTYQYELVFTYQASGSTPGYSAHAVGNFTIDTQPGAAPVNHDTTPSSIPPIAGVQLASTSINGLPYHVMEWARPGVGASVFEWRGLGSSDAWVSKDVFEPGVANIPAGWQCVALGNWYDSGPSSYEFRVTYTDPATGAISRTTGTYHVPQSPTAADVTSSTPHYTQVELKTAVIDGTGYSVLQWPMPEAGTTVTVLRDGQPAGVFNSGDEHGTQMGPYAGQCVVVYGTSTYEIDFAYANGSHAYATIQTTMPSDSQWSATVDAATAAPPPVPGGVGMYPVTINGAVRDVLYWNRPPNGSTMLEVRDFATNQLMSGAPAYQQGPFDAIVVGAYGPGKFKYTLTLTAADGSVHQSTGWFEIPVYNHAPIAPNAANSAVYKGVDLVYTGEAGSARPRVHQQLDRWGNVLAVNDARKTWGQAAATGQFADWRTTYKYNANNQLIEQSLPEDTVTGVTYAVTKYYYDKLGRQVGMKDPRTSYTTVAGGTLFNQDIYNWQLYDAGGNMTREEHADGGHIDYKYNAFGEKVQSTQTVTANQEDNVVKNFSYDKMGRLLKTSLAGQGVQVYGVERQDVLHFEGQEGPMTAGQTIDSINAVDLHSIYENLIEENQYDETGRKIKVIHGGTVVEDQGVVRTVHEYEAYKYDRRGNVVQSGRSQSEAPTPELKHQISYTYDALGRMTSQTDANGASHTQTWTFNYFGRLIGHTDFALNRDYGPDDVQHVTTFWYGYSYDNAGQLTDQINSLGQNLHYDYDSAGQLVKIRDNHLGQTTTYTYDLGGRHLSEVMSQETRLPTGYQMEVVYQNNHMVYDAQGRLRVAANSSASVNMEYDKAGNRVKTTTWMNGVKVEDPYYGYDAMNRQVSGQNRLYSYDLAGNRITEKVGAGSEAHAYSYDKLGRLTQDTMTVNAEGVAVNQLAQQYLYDGAGRNVVTRSVTTFNNAAATETRYNIFDANTGDLLKADAHTRSGTNGQGALLQAHMSDYDHVDYKTGHDLAGNLLGSVESTFGPSSGSGRNTLENIQTTYTYTHNGGYQVAKIHSLSDHQDTSDTNNWYDANGFLSNVVRDNGANNVAFANDAQGHAVYINRGAGSGVDTGRIMDAPGGYYGGSIGNQANPGHVQRQMIVNGEALLQYGETSNGVAYFDQTPTYATQAELLLGAGAQGNTGTGSATSYTVIGGETLQSIARTTMGDERLWYLIAEANGLSGSGDLVAGQTLTIPARQVSSNNSTTFRPYDPSRTIGDLSPAMPMPQSGDGGCGGIGQIIMTIVAVAVAVYTQQYYLVGDFGTAAAAEAVATANLPDLAVSGAIGGAAGSVASQVVGIAIGAQKDFNWKGVALGALSGGMAPGLANAGLAVSGFGGIGNAIINGAIANAATQGIGVVTGLQKSFDWRGVAASAAGAGVGSAVSEGLGLTDNSGAKTGAFKSDFGQQLWRSAVTGLAAGTTAAIMRGGSVSIQQVATDAFGNAIGQGLVDQQTSDARRATEAFRLSDAAYGGADTAPEPYTGSGLRVGRGTGLFMSQQAYSNWSNVIDDGIAAKSGAGPLDEVVSNGSIRNALYRSGVDDAGFVKVHEVGGHFSDLQYVGQAYVGAYSPKLARSFTQADLNLMVAHSQFLDQLKDLDAKAAGERYLLNSDNRERLIQQGLHSLNDLGAATNEARIIDLLQRNPGNLALAGAAAHPFVDAAPHENKDQFYGHTLESWTGRNPDPLNPATAVKLGSKLVNYFEVVLGVSADATIAGQSGSIRDQAMQNVRDAVKSARETGATGEAFDEQFGAAGRYLLPQGSLRLPTLPSYGLGARYNSLPFEALATTEEYLQSIQLRVSKYKFLYDALDSAATIMNHYMDYTGRHSVPPVQANQLLGRTFNVDGKPVGRY